MEHVPDLAFGPPYEFKKKITCAHCIDILNTARAAWEKKFSEKYDLPEDFWDTYKTSWD